MFRQDQYEEEIYLRLDGSADGRRERVDRGAGRVARADLSTDPGVTIDRDKIRAFYQSPATRVTRVSRPWRRSGRRFIQVRVATERHSHARRAPRRSPGRPTAWTSAAGSTSIARRWARRPASRLANVGWNGDELVAVRMHVPSKIPYHNAPSREIERGNILGWEQPLRDRLAGKPLDIEVRMETDSILARTLTIFGLSAAAALALLGAVVLLGSPRGGRKRIGAERIGA